MKLKFRRTAEVDAMAIVIAAFVALFLLALYREDIVGWLNGQ